MFLIYINDLDTGVCSDLSKFADDTKIGKIIKTEADVRTLQADLDRMSDWGLNGKWNLTQVSVE